jgi:hypothetical protein
MRNLIIFSVIFMMFGGSGHSQEAYFDEESALIFPMEIGKFDFQGQRNYEQPGLGYSLRYGDDNFFKVDIYVYDNTYKEIKDGISSKEVADEFNSAAANITSMEKLGYYENVEELYIGEAVFGQKGFKFLWAQFQYEQTPADEVQYFGKRISNTYLTAINGKFIKVRLTLKKKEQIARKGDIDSFMKDLSAVLLNPNQ